MKPEEHLPYLDGWRGFAIALVLLQHFKGIYRPDLGRFGVDLFFVLSGLLMSRILFERQMPIGKFYRRRISRIMPVFLLFVGIVWIGWSDTGASWQELATTLTFTRNYYQHPDIWRSVIPDANLWSLNVEEHCYVILALIATIPALRARAPLILLGLAALTLPAFALHAHLTPNVRYTLMTECASAGLFLSAAYRPFAARWRAPAWMPIAALAVAFLCYFKGYYWFPRFIVGPPLLAFAVNHVQESWKWAVKVLEWRPLRQLGVLSYSIYLWQQPFYDHQQALPWHHTAFIGAVLAGTLSYYLFELPARRWLNAHWGGQRAPIAVPVAG
jgi:peptidoglycan/LPS O-acetylase OafA/YrhL